MSSTESIILPKPRGKAYELRFFGINHAVNIDHPVGTPYLASIKECINLVTHKWGREFWNPRLPPKQSDASVIYNAIDHQLKADAGILRLFPAIGTAADSASRPSEPLKSINLHIRLEA